MNLRETIKVAEDMDAPELEINNDILKKFSKSTYFPSMTFEEYLDFLEEYWELFGPIPEPKPKIQYTMVLI